MTLETPPADPLDLLIIGGLTIDRFANGDLAPGGSVLHATRAATRAGLRTGVVTTAGEEKTARAGLDELRHLAQSVEIQQSADTIGFRHRETPAGRRLWLERAGGRLKVSEVVRQWRMHAVLFAPVASEVDARILHALSEPYWMRGAILQGWLRRANVGEEVQPIAPSELADDLVAALADLTILVASREDLQAAASSPRDQVAVLRRRIGIGPTLVVTDGAEGVWIDVHHGEPRHLAVPWRVENVPTVGAGDAFAALYLARIGSVMPGRGGDAVIEEAMVAVAEILEDRRS